VLIFAFKIGTPILNAKSANVNIVAEISNESNMPDTDINDFLENIRILLEYIISENRKKSK